MKFKFILAATTAMCLHCAVSTALPVSASKEYRDAVRLYENGMYERARTIFETISATQTSPMSDGYALLCSVNLKTAGYEEVLTDFFRRYGRTPLNSQIHHQYALNLFDEQRYPEASAQFDQVAKKNLSRLELTELMFKRAYCEFGQSNYPQAAERFQEVLKRPASEYTAPSQYALGYIAYNDNLFKDALEYFEKSAEDPRFAEPSMYYMLECAFMLKDYEYVAKHGDDIYAQIPEERRPHLARILSESYLVMGNTGKAKKYFDLVEADDQTIKSRADYFYAGSLQYSLRDFEKAIQNFTKMGERTDSIGQIASYQLGYSYIQTKNKVAAMNAFKDAMESVYDARIKEDALFNYAKLAFDLNHDNSGFNRYLKEYRNSGRNDMIYDYIAVANLFNHDYAGAVEAYDNIENLSPAMKSNYMKANFLRAEQLISKGSYTDAIPCLKASTFFTSRQDNFNKFARYWLGESYYKTENYAEAAKIFTDLYNNSALDNKEEGRILPYNVAYSYFNAEDYESAADWFDKYVASGEKSCREDALIRRADCDFIRKDYKAAAESYGRAAEATGVDNVYPLYQQGISYGLAGKKNEKVAALSKVLNVTKTDVPYYAEALYELGRSYIATNKEAKAIETFKELAFRSSDSTYVAKSLIELAMIERNNKHTDQALKYYRKVAEDFRGSESAEAAMLAVESIYQAQGEPEKYLAFTESLGKPAKSAEEKELVYFNSAEQIFLTANYEKAVIALNKYFDAYPEGGKAAEANFYMAESYRFLGNKEKACDYYSKVIGSSLQSNSKELAILHFGDLSYDLGHYRESYSAYSNLLGTTVVDENRLFAQTGMMNAAFAAKEYADAIAAADAVQMDTKSTSALRRRAEYVKARSYLGTSRRDEAFEIFRLLAQQPATDEGAEATYMLIQNTYDEGQFEKVEKAVYKFADAAPDQGYWLAKAFIVLGDSFVENDNLRQAKATFESILNGYEPAQGTTDDITENVRMRLEKLNEIMNK